MITVSGEQVRRYTLGKEGLLTRQPLDALQPTLGPLHATDYTTPYLSLLARVQDFAWEQLADLRYDERGVIRKRCMRGTIHLVPAPQLDDIECIYNAREDDPVSEFQLYDISLDEAYELRFHITEILQQQGPQSSISIKKLLDPALIFKHRSPSGGETTSIGPVIRWMWQLGLVDSGAGANTWRKKDALFQLAEGPPLQCSDEKRLETIPNLARWYFGLYGPASYADWAWWSGLKGPLNKAGFDALQDEGELVQVNVENWGALWMLAADADTLQATPDNPVEMVRLLPYEDAMLKGYKNTRHRFYDVEGLAEDVAFSKGGEAYPTIMVDGRIFGIWSWAKKANEPMTMEPFIQMTKAARKRLKPELDRVSNFIEASHVLWTS